jgi:hypothetical protein
LRPRRRGFCIPIPIRVVSRRLRGRLRDHSLVTWSENYTVEYAGIAGRIHNQKIKPRSIQQVRQHFRRWARTDVGGYLFLFRARRYWDLGAGALMNRIQDLRQSSFVTPNRKLATVK